MKRKKFNPYDWIPKPQKNKPAPRQQPVRNPGGTQYEVEIIIRRIEANQLDLTANYMDWLSIGFSLADEFGESGRNYFQRVSQFHPDYDYKNCSKQFDKCIRQHKCGITIKTFFYMCRNAGINIKV